MQARQWPGIFISESFTADLLFPHKHSAIAVARARRRDALSRIALVGMSMVSERAVESLEAPGPSGADTDARKDAFAGSSSSTSRSTTAATC